MFWLSHKHKKKDVIDINTKYKFPNTDTSDIEEHVVLLNQAKRHPVVALVDTSESMKKYEELLERIINDLYKFLLDDRLRATSAELAVITFNNKIEILERMREIKCQEAQGKNLNFHCHGCTLTGLALKSAIMQIEGRKKVYSRNVPKIRYYCPVLLVISDGIPKCLDDNVKEQEKEAMAFSKAYIKEMVDSGRLVVISATIGNHGDNDFMRELIGLDNDNRIVKICRDKDLEKLRNFFLYNICRFPHGPVGNIY